MNEQIYTNYRLLLPNEEILGTLIVRNGKIADIQPGITNKGENGEGKYLIPGLIELHTDNLERCMSPRPGIR
ncbi:MAG: phosphonate metabolism protein PhnM, partial [Cyanobacteriota bacterium]